MRLLLLLAFVFSASSVMADTNLPDNAKHCIQQGKSKYSQTLTNRCDKTVVLIWCHDKGEKGYRDGLCGKGKGFYRMNTVLKPGEVKENLYTLPPDSSISYGACFGSWGDYRLSQQDGEYLCIPAGKKLVTVTSDAKGDTLEEACSNAREQAKPGIDIGECQCQTAEKTSKSVCRVTSSQPEKESTFIGDAKNKLHQHLEKCDSKRDGFCPEKSPPRNGGSGRRG